MLKCKLNVSNILQSLCLLTHKRFKCLICSLHITNQQHFHDSTKNLYKIVRHLNYTQLGCSFAMFSTVFSIHQCLIYGCRYLYVNICVYEHACVYVCMYLAAERLSQMCLRYKHALCCETEFSMFMRSLTLRQMRKKLNVVETCDYRSFLN